MKKLLVYLRPYRLQAILAPVFKLLEAAFELLVPLIMADIIDVGIAAGDTGYILKKCLLLVGLGLCGFASATCAQYFSAKAATGATASLRHALFAHIQSLSYAELDTIGPATLVTRMTSDMNQVQTGLNLTLRLLLRSPIVVFGSMIMAFTIDVRSALIFVVTIPVLFAIVFAIMLSCIPLYRRVQAKLDGVTGAAQENLSGVRVIRAFTREQTETESFDGRLDGLFAAQRFVGKLSALLNPLTYVVINLAVVLPESLTSPVLTAEWENRLTEIAKGNADADEFMAEIEAQVRQLVKTYSCISADKQNLFQSERVIIGKCPRCSENVYEGKKNFYCWNRSCQFVMWKNDRFFEQRKKAFTPKIAAALLKNGKAKVKGLYSEKTGKTYDATVLLADTGGKYVNYRVERKE